jgi:hypothetical protein
MSKSGSAPRLDQLTNKIHQSHQEVLLVVEQSPWVRTIVQFALVLIFAVKTIFSDSLIVNKHMHLMLSTDLIALDFWLDPMILDFPNVMSRLYRFCTTVSIMPIIGGKSLTVAQQILI